MVTEEEYKSWLVPAALMERAKAAKGGSTAIMLTDYLRGGRILVCKFVVQEPEGNGSTFRSDSAIGPIDTALWKDLQNWNFWNDGYAKFDYWDVYGNVVVYAYDVRFDPIEIDKILPLPDPTVVACGDVWRRIRRIGSTI